MAESIAVDLMDTQQCKATDMIKFLLAFCLSQDGKTVPVHDEEVLGRTFAEARNIANCSGTILETELSKL